MFRSARRLCNACDDESPSCSSDRSWLVIIFTLQHCSLKLRYVGEVHARRK